MSKLIISMILKVFYSEFANSYLVSEKMEQMFCQEKQLTKTCMYMNFLIVSSCFVNWTFLLLIRIYQYLIEKKQLVLALKLLYFLKKILIVSKMPQNCKQDRCSYHLSIHPLTHLSTWLPRFLSLRNYIFNVYCCLGIILSIVIQLGI